MVACASSVMPASTLAAFALVMIAAAAPPPQCRTVTGYSFVGAAALPGNPNLRNVSTVPGCCHACASTPSCVTFTLHPSNGCWLHGAGGTPKACGDGSLCKPPPLPPPNMVQLTSPFPIPFSAASSSKTITDAPSMARPTNIPLLGPTRGSTASLHPK